MNHKRTEWDDVSEKLIDTAANLNEADSGHQAVKNLDAEMDRYQERGYNKLQRILRTTTDPEVRGLAAGALGDFGAAETTEAEMEAAHDSEGSSNRRANQTNTDALGITETERKKVKVTS